MKESSSVKRKGNNRYLRSPIENLIIWRQMTRLSKDLNNTYHWELINYLKKIGVYQILYCIYFNISGKSLKLNLDLEEEIAVAFEEILLRDPYVLDDTYSLRLSNLMEVEFMEHLAEPIYELIKSWCVRYEVDPNLIIEGLTLLKLNPEVSYYLFLKEEGLQRRMSVIQESLRSKREEEENVLLSQVNQDLEWLQPAIEMVSNNPKFDLLTLVEKPDELLDMMNSPIVEGLTRFINNHKLSVLQEISIPHNLPEEGIICWTDEAWVKSFALFLLDMLSQEYAERSSNDVSYLDRIKKVNSVLWDRWILESRKVEKNPSLVRLLKLRMYPLLEFWALGTNLKFSSLSKFSPKILSSLKGMLTELREVPKDSAEANLLLSVKVYLDSDQWLSNVTKAFFLKVKDTSAVIKSTNVPLNHYQPYLRKYKVQEAMRLNKNVPVEKDRIEKVDVKQPWLTYKREDHQEVLNCNNDLNLLLSKHTVALEHVKELKECLNSTLRVKNYDHGRTINLLALTIILRSRQGYENLFLIRPNKVWQDPFCLPLLRWSMPRCLTSLTGKMILGILICSFSQSVLIVPFVWTSVVFFSHFAVSYLIGYVTLSIINILPRSHKSTLNLSNRLPGEVSIPAYCKQQLVKYVTFGLPILALLHSPEVSRLRRSSLENLSRFVPEWLGNNLRTPRFTQPKSSNLPSDYLDLIVNPNLNVFSQPLSLSKNLEDSPIKKLRNDVIRYINPDEVIGTLVEVISQDLLSLWSNSTLLIFPGFTLPFLVSVNIFCNSNVPRYDGSKDRLSSIKSAMRLNKCIKTLVKFNKTFVTVSVLLGMLPACCLLSLTFVTLGIDPYFILQGMIDYVANLYV